jgi:hypothetical protein
VRSLPVIIAAIFLTAAVSRAQTLSLPLHGYFHPGRAMPVACDFSGSPGSANISGQGAITTRIFSVTGTRAIVPFLAFDPEAHSATFDLHALDDSDLLIAAAQDDLSAAPRLFPGKIIVSLKLDPIHPIEGPAMAWESLDALLLTPVGLANIPEPKLRELWSSGITIVVIAPNSPPTDLPWTKESGCWIARGFKSLPAQVNPDAYAPTLQWTGGKSLATRREIVLLGALFGILLGAIALWPSRTAPTAAICLAVTLCFAADWNSHRHFPVTSAEGIMQIDVGRRWGVDDVWTFQRSHRDTEFDLPLSGSVHPIMMETDQWSQANLILTCGSNGDPVALQGQLKADVPIALVMRKIARADFLAGGPVASPMRLLTDLYPSFSVQGQRGPDQWATQTPRTHFGAIVLRPISSP